MNIPATKHARIKYRNGESGQLLTTERKETAFKILTLRDKKDSIIHHNSEGEYLSGGVEHDFDIVEVEA